MNSFFSKHIVLLCACLIVSGCERAPDSTPSQKTSANETREPELFSKLTDFEVSGETAEIVAAAPDGNTLVFADSLGKSLGFVDVRDAARPRSLKTILVDGEPTSVAVSPDGRWLLSCVRGAKNHLLVFSWRTRKLVRRISLPGQPDCIAVSPDSRFAAIAIENERGDIKKPMPQTPAGSLAILELGTMKLRVVDLRGLPIRFPHDPEPEYIAINAKNHAAVTLQENNGVAIIDLANAKVLRAWSAGTTSHPADLKKDKKVDFSDTLKAPREPDGIAWTPGGNLLTANEGDLDSHLEAGEWAGGRNATLFSSQGRVLHDFNDIETIAAQNNAYSDKRSEKRGVEPEGVAVARFETDGDARTLAFMGCERADGVAVFDVSDEAAPRFVQFLKTGKNPEGVLALAGRSLFVSANEGDGTLSIFRMNAKN